MSIKQPKNRFIINPILNLLGSAWIIPGFIIILYIDLSCQKELNLSVPHLIGVTAMVMILIVLAAYLCRQGKVHLSPIVILSAATIMRLVFLFNMPQLSDDIFRYRLDGQQLLNGHNPYAMAPDRINPENDDIAQLLTKVNHSHLVTIYPPLAQLIFALGASLDWGILGIKLLLIVFDLLTCLIILKLLKGLNIPEYHLIFYAWHPLPTIEIAASGHIDGAAMFFILLTFLCLLMDLRQKRQYDPKPVNGKLQPILQHRIAFSLFSVTAGVAFTCAVLIKLYPIIFLPAIYMVLLKSQKRLFTLSAFLCGVFVTMPFFPEIWNMLNTLVLYTTTWEFSGFLYRTLRNLNFPSLQARIVLGIAFVSAACLTLCKPHFCRSSKKDQTLQKRLAVSYQISFLFLLLTPTLHPWYGLCLAIFLPFTSKPAGIIFTWAVFLGYRVLIPYSINRQWIEDDVTVFMIWIAPVLGHLFEKIFLHFENNNGRILLKRNQGRS